MDAANALADAWGPAVTKLMVDKDTAPVEALCADTVEIVLGTSDSQLISFTVGNEDAAAINWSEFQEVTAKDIEPEYKETQSASLGFLGNRMILEAGRVNKDDELYLTTVSLVTLDEQGKIAKYESFADSLAPSLLDAAIAKQVVAE